MHTDFYDRLDVYVAEIQKRMRADQEPSPLPPPFLTVDPKGKRYTRIVVNSGPSRSAHSFVDKKDGNIYKPAGWRAPTFNIVRGNIFTEDFGFSAIDGRGTLITYGNTGRRPAVRVKVSGVVSHTVTDATPDGYGP